MDHPETHPQPDATSPKEAAEALVAELAFADQGDAQIKETLRERGLAAVLSEDEFFAIATRSRAAREQIPRPLGKLLPRVVGFIAVLLGAAVLYIVSSSHVQMPHLGATPVSLGGRYNPAGGAILAIILGLVLIIAPRWSREDH